MIPESRELEDFRRDVRAWLEKNVPADWRDQMTGASDEAFVRFQRKWFGRLKEGGYAVPHWPKEWGGGGLGFAEQIILYEEMARADAPRARLFFISLYHTPATLLEWGTEAQKKRHLPAIIDGEVWCQGFSEPGAGSDLAALATKARRDGDHFVVDGQKIWSSSAQHADYCLLLARTDPAAPKHKGISYFILDLKTPGVEIRPIVQMPGGAEFNEIFLDGVRIPAENLVGPENGGWRVAQTTLSSERGLTILELSARMSHAYGDLVALALRKEGVSSVAALSAALRRQLVAIHGKIETLRILVYDMLTKMLNEGAAGIGASVIKVYYSQLLREFTALGLDLRGLDGQYLSPAVRGGGQETGNWMVDYLTSWSWTIAGGSNEVQRNIISERGLGLPKEPRPT